MSWNNATHMISNRFRAIRSCCYLPLPHGAVKLDRNIATHIAHALVRIAGVKVVADRQHRRRPSLTLPGESDAVRGTWKCPCARPITLSMRPPCDWIRSRRLQAVKREPVPPQLSSQRRSPKLISCPAETTEDVGQMLLSIEAGC